jgi:hypothetical protein
MPLPAPGWAACAYVQLSMRRSGTRPKCPVLFVTRVRGRGSQLAIVASTLVIAALFNPLRQRGQNLIDRRLYRSKYDAQKTLSAFSEKLREETDLEALNAELLSVIRETMQPEHISLWLRQT